MVKKDKQPLNTDLNVMRSKNIVFALLLVILLSVNNCLANTKLQTLWESFYIESERLLFTDPVKNYEVNTDNTIICFIYKQSVFIFKNGQINKVRHAKMFNMNGINRISVEQTSAGEAFKLWSNEKLIIKICS